ncbi:hypothetical protein VoSk93_34360 [Vibrio owensii]
MSLLVNSNACAEPTANKLNAKTDVVIAFMMMLLFLKFGISVCPKRNSSPSLSIKNINFKPISDTFRNIFKFVLIDDLFGLC